VTDSAVDHRVDQAVWGLERDRPEFSAYRVLWVGQRIGLVLVLGVLTACFLAWPSPTATVVLVLVNLAYLGVVVFRGLVFVRGLRAESVATVTDDEARAVPDDELPVYTVLLPAFREPSIVADLLAGVGRLEYPRDKLDIKLLLEADDEPTVTAAREAASAGLVEVVLVPPAEPRTKPKACNYGLAEARGEFCTIYDAEDRPDPLQLRRAVVAFGRLGPATACLQARLTYFNGDQNLLTRWFSLEYDAWFANMLPGLASMGAPIPLGGTSNHVRTAALLQAGGWDAFNVTEDADLGLRLARLGYGCAVLDSETEEEANSDVINWVRQRSRWYKGYLQTGLVHLRQPRRLLSELGLGKTVAFFLLVPGTPVLGLFNLVVWGITISWWLGAPPAIGALFPTWLYLASLVAFTLGNFLMVYINVVVSVRTRDEHLLLPALIFPLYWLLMAAAAVKAFVQLVVNPSYWEKTHHGLTGG
jgi:cellulose synthase/poly-beta-1,6-N-acetylglucosamine synthase-like glycosyltransferase